MAGILLLLPHDIDERFAEQAGRHGHEVLARCETVEQLLPLLSESEFAVVSARHEVLTPDVLAEADTAGVRLIAVVSSSAERLHVASLGLREVVDTIDGWSGVERLLATTTLADAAPAGPATSLLIAVWGPSGAPGRSTIAITLAAEFAALSHRVILADADTHAAAIAPTLALAEEAPGFAAACRLAAADSLTPAELGRVAQLYSSPLGSFQVLTGLPRPSRWPELTESAISGTLTASRAMADVVVVDVASSLEEAPVPRNIAARAALAAADRVISVGSGDPVGLARFLRDHPGLLEVATGDVTVLVNRVRASALGLAPRDQVTQALARFGGIREAVIVPDDRPAFDAAVLAGRTVTDIMPRSPARRAVAELAASLMPAREQPPHRRARRLSRVSG